MAIAKKCDKCGVLYEKTTVKPRLSVYENTVREDGREITKGFDLCEDCCEVVLKFIIGEAE